MLKDLEDLKRLTEWMKSERVAQFKVDGIEVTFAPVAFLPQSLTGLPDEPKKTEEEQKREEDSVLFHSAG